MLYYSVHAQGKVNEFSDLFNLGWIRHSTVHCDMSNSSTMCVCVRVTISLLADEIRPAFSSIGCH